MAAKSIYPNIATAPPDISFERYNKIKDIYNDLKLMKEKRKTIYKKYSKASSGLNTSIMVLSSFATAEATAGIITSLTVIGLPIGIILTGISGVTGLSALILTPISKYINKKKLKHGKLYSVLDTAMILLSKRISTALDDSIIEDKEFNEIIDEYANIKKKMYEFDYDKIKDEAKQEIKKNIN